MVEYLKENFSLPWLIKREIKRSALDGGGVHYSEAGKILILFTMQGNARINRMRELQKLFEADGKKVLFLYVLLNQEDQADAHLDEGMFRMEKKDISLRGKILRGDLQNLLKEKFDFLIHADLESNVYADYMLSKIRAGSKVGRHVESREYLYDLMIEIGPENKLNFLLEEIYKYTKVI